MQTPPPSAQGVVSSIETALGPLPAHVRAAFLAVDRARFVRPCDRALAWQNGPLPLDTPHGQTVPPVAELIARYGAFDRALGSDEFRAAGATISQPLVYAMAFLLLNLRPGGLLLELGTGTGYGAALAAHVVGPAGRVTSVDVDPYLVARARELTADLAQVTLLHDDGLTRADLVAAHDRAWLTFSVTEPPRGLTSALPEGGLLLAPVGPPPPETQRLLRFSREGGVVMETQLPFPVTFIGARARIDA